MVHVSLPDQDPPSQHLGMLLRCSLKPCHSRSRRFKVMAGGGQGIVEVGLVVYGADEFVAQRGYFVA